MGIPGYSFNLPQNDPSMPMPIPKINQSASLNLNYASTDQFADEEEKLEEIIFLKPNLFQPPLAKISPFEFAQKIHHLLRDQSEEMIKTMDENFHAHENSFAFVASELRIFRSKIEIYLIEWIKIEEEYSHYTQKLNGQIALIKKVQVLYEEDIHFFKEIIPKFYKIFEELNERIFLLNKEGKKLGLKLIPKIPLDNSINPKTFNYFSKRKQPNVIEILKNYYEPMHNAIIGYMTDLKNLLNIPKELKAFNELNPPLIDSSFLNLFEVDSTFISHPFLEDLVFTRAISSLTLEKILASTAIRTAMLEAKLPLTKIEIDQIQLLIINLMSKAALQSPSGCFSLLGKEWAKIGITEEQIKVFLAISMNQRILSFIQQGVVKENVTILIQSNERISNLAHRNIPLLINKLSSIINLALLQQGLVQLAISMKFPPFIKNVLLTTLLESGIAHNSFRQSFNDVFNDRSYIAFLESIMKGSEEKKELDFLEKAFEKTLLNGPYADLQLLIEQLSLEIQYEGNLTEESSDKFALNAADLLIKLAPQASLDDRKMFLGITVPLINKDDLLSGYAVAKILSKYTQEKFLNIYKTAINHLYNQCSYEAIFSSLLRNYFLDKGNDNDPPMTIKDIFIALYKFLLAGGASMDESLGIADATVRYLVDLESAQEAFKMAPSKIKVILKYFYDHFEKLGLTRVESTKISPEIIKYLIENKLLNTNLQDYNMIFDCISSFIYLKASVLDITLIKWSDIKEPVGKKIFSQSSSSFEKESLNLAIRNQLKQIDSKYYMPDFIQLFFDSSINLHFLEEELKIYHLPKQLAGMILPFISSFALPKFSKPYFFEIASLKRLLSKKLYQFGYTKEQALLVSKIILENALFSIVHKDWISYYNNVLLHLQFSLGIDRDQCEKILPKENFKNSYLKKEEFLKREKLNISKILKDKLADDSYVIPSLLHILNVEKDSEFYLPLKKALKMTFKSLRATTNEINFKNEWLDNLSDLLSHFHKFDEIKEKIEKLLLPKFLIKHLVTQQIILLSSKNKNLPEIEMYQLQLIGDRFFRKLITLDKKENLPKLLEEILNEPHFLTEKEIHEIANQFKFDLLEGDFQKDVLNQVSVKLYEILKNVISNEKIQKNQAELIKTIEMIQSSIQEQVNILVNETDSKNYKQLILQGVLDTMQSTTQINFDLFLFSEILNSNGKQMMKLIHEALLSEIGVNENSYSQTIDFLI